MAGAPIRCRIEEVLGRDEVCPEEGCPFWETGGLGLGACGFEQIDLHNNPSVAEWLRHVRKLIQAERAT